MFRKYYLAIKYFLQGDDWESAKIYAAYITDWTAKRDMQIRKIRKNKRG